MGSSSERLKLRPGAYAVTLTFFKPDTEELGLVTLKKHVVCLGQAGLLGIVALGSSGEAAHLTASERDDVAQTVRQSLNGAGFEHLPVIVGASGQSVFKIINLYHQAATAGGDYVLILLSSCYKAEMTDDAVFNFYMAVAAISRYYHGTEGTLREICKRLFDLSSTEDQSTTISYNPIEAKRYSVTKQDRHAFVV